MAKSRSVGHLLNNANTGLAKVIDRAKELKKLTTQLKSMVDAPLSDHIYVANIRGTTLIIGTDSAAWHTRIKYLAPMILDRLQQIEFRVQPFSAGVENASKTQPQQAANSGQHGNGDPDENQLDQRLAQLSRKIRDNE